MTRRIHLDIETYRTRNEQTIARLLKHATVKNPFANALADTSKNAMYAEILTICFKTENPDVVVIDAMEQSEKSALVQFNEAVNDFADSNTIWSAFNGKGFDFPVLLNRMVRHGVRPSDHFPSYSRYWNGRIFDSMERFPVPKLMTSFSGVCEVYGLPCKTIVWRDEPMDGSKVGEAYESGEYQIIRDYCMDDVINEERLYLAMTHNDTWGTFDNGNNDLSALSEIANDDDMSPAHKWAAAYPILKSARLIL